MLAPVCLPGIQICHHLLQLHPRPQGPRSLNLAPNPCYPYLMGMQIFSCCYLNVPPHSYLLLTLNRVRLCRVSAFLTALGQELWTCASCFVATLDFVDHVPMPGICCIIRNPAEECAQSAPRATFPSPPYETKAC